MDKRKFLVWPWDGYERWIESFLKKIENCTMGHVRLDMSSRKYDYIKEDGEVIGPKREQSLEYMIKNWPKNHPRRVAIQAGGCMGFWPKVLSSVFDLVYTFEAQPEAFFFVTLNCPERNIIKMQAALGAKGGNFVEVAPTNRPGKGKVTKGNNIPVLALDDFNFSICDALMLDVEGYEPQILRGAQQLINRCKPYVLCEDNWNSDEIKLILESYGYELITKVNKDRIFKHKSKEWPGGQWEKK